MSAADLSHTEGTNKSPSTPPSSDLQEILERVQANGSDYAAPSLTVDEALTALEALIQKRERKVLVRMLEVGAEKDNYATRVLNNINETIATLSNNEEKSNGSI